MEGGTTTAKKKKGTFGVYVCVFLESESGRRLFCSASTLSLLLLSDKPAVSESTRNDGRAADAGRRESESVGAGRDSWRKRGRRVREGRHTGAWLHVVGSSSSLFENQSVRNNAVFERRVRRCCVVGRADDAS